MSIEPFVPDGVWVPRAILAIASRFAVPLFLEIRRHCYERPECFPGVRRLARAIGCAIGTVSALTDQFDALGIVKKMHDGRHCVYRCAQGCWHRRKSRKTAHCSAGRTEDRINKVDSIDKGKNHKTDVSQTRAKRQSLLRTLRRWCQISPHLPDDERSHRISVLDRAEDMLDDWWHRSREDQACFELLVARSRQFPLEPACLQSLAQKPLGMPAIGAFVPVFNRVPV